jgi:beta-glucosidase
VPSDASFPEGFLWGVATSAYQVEGAVHEDGRGPSIWDTFSHTPGRTRDGHTGDVACDQYHRYEEDAALLAELGIRAYRFSVAWPRIQPEGAGPANPAGLDHYRRLVDALQRRGITPVVTLYHWDLPQALQDRGGWPERDTAWRFADYAAIVGEALGPDVPFWITLNEPWVAAWLGYGTGVHAPGERDDRRALAATHHLLLAHGLAREALRVPGRVGIALNLEPHRPASDQDEDVRAAHLADLHMNALLLDPLFGRGYPPDLVEHYRAVSDLGFVRDGDLEAMARPLDFLGVNYYRRQTIAGREPDEGIVAEVPGSLGAWSVVPPGEPVTTMGWPIDPSGLTEILLRVGREYGPEHVIVTENGAAFDDTVGPDGRVDDPARIAFLAGHLAALLDARRAGVPVEGYLVWSLLDNFEWAEGYHQRFGLVHVDLATQRRTPKSSARWYGEVVRSRGASLAPAAGGPPGNGRFDRGEQPVAGYG